MGNRRLSASEDSTVEKGECTCITQRACGQCRCTPPCSPHAVRSGASGPFNTSGSFASSSKISLALINEKSRDLDRCFQNLTKAKEYIFTHSIDSLKPKLYIRLSSYYRFVEKEDSVLKYAELALQKSQKENNILGIVQSLLVVVE